MSDKTSSMSNDQIESTVPVLHRGLQLVFSPERPKSNSVISVSSDSNSSISSMSDTEASSSPDINMLEHHCSDCSPMDDMHNTTLTQGDGLCGITMNQTFIATPVNERMDFWNENLSLASNEERESKKCQTFCTHPEGETNSARTSPDSAGRDSQLSSCETSCRGSTENDCCSLNSGEMVIRNNSFCLEDQPPSVASSLEESFNSLPANHKTFPAESNLLSTTLPDVCEKSPERVKEENKGHLCLGETFTQTDSRDLLTEEHDVAIPSSFVALPSESEGGLLMTFICETSANFGKEAKSAGAEAELSPHFSGAVTSLLDKTFVSTRSLRQESEKGFHTSTPIQNIGNKTPSLPSFSESPCLENASSPGLHPVIQHQISITPKQSVATGLTPSASKIKKMEIEKFPKSDYRTVKFKVITRASDQMTVLGPASQQKPSQVNMNNKPPETQRGPTIRISPAKLRSGTTSAFAATKVGNDPQKRVNTGAANLGVKMKPPDVVDEQGESRTSPPDHQPAANEHTSADQCSNTTSETELAASVQRAGSKTSCLEKSPNRRGQTDPKPAPKTGVSNKIEVRSGSALGQDKPPLLKTRLRCSSESSSLASRPPKEKKTLSFSPSSTISKADTQQTQVKPENLNCSSQKKRTTQTGDSKGPAHNSSREIKKLSLVAETSKSATGGASSDGNKSRFRGRPSPSQTRRAPLLQPPSASPGPATLSARPRQGTLGRNECKISKGGVTLQAKQKNNTGSQRVQTTGTPFIETPSAARIKLQLDGSRPPQTPTRSSLSGPPSTPSYRLPRKTPEPSRGLKEASVLGQSIGNTQVGGAAQKATPFKSVVLKARLISTPGKNTGPALAPACKPMVSTSKGASNFTASSLRKTVSARFLQPPSSGPVDRSKSKASSRQQHPQQQASQAHQSNGSPNVVPPASVTESERKDIIIQQLKGLLTASNYRFEAVAIVLQQTLAERDEATRQCRELSQEMVNLRGELVCSVHSSERLEKEKEELRVALEDALQKVREQHQTDLAELEQRLQAFYQTEWDKVHLTYQEEADKCKSLMQQQMGEFKANHEAMKLELQSSHVEQLQCVKQQYEKSLEELRQVHNQELQSLDKTLKDAEASLSGQIQELTVENNALIEKLAAEENRSKELAEKSQKDSHTLYLEQELDSLKVVLDIKTKQLHQQEKKLMEMDKLTEKSVKLDESLKKVQQENEDLKARMERHAALSRQLSTEQAMLQESLQKESKVNKRLSMENEELLWKLHNGDLSSPRKVSPTSTSPSHSFSLQSPRSSGLFSSPPISPR